MTQLRRDPLVISNYFDDLERGLGHRGSSFTDLDGVSHDGRTGRFLVREFKRHNEPCLPGQKRLLEALAVLPQFTVWYLHPWRDGQIAWADMRRPDSIDVLTEDDYRDHVAEWWAGRYSRAEIAR